jgi:molybdopterin synthase sulfur carrier subunit
VKVTVKGYFDLQKAMGGKSRVEVEKGAVTIREVLDELSRRFGKAFIETIYDSETGQPAGHIMLLVNGRNYLSLPAKLDTDLNDGDEIALFPPIAGG